MQQWSGKCCVCLFIHCSHLKENVNRYTVLLYLKYKPTNCNCSDPISLSMTPFTRSRLCESSLTYKQYTMKEYFRPWQCRTEWNQWQGPHPTSLLWHLFGVSCVLIFSDQYKFKRHPTCHDNACRLADISFKKKLNIFDADSGSKTIFYSSPFHFSIKISKKWLHIQLFAIRAYILKDLTAYLLFWQYYRWMRVHLALTLYCLPLFKVGTTSKGLQRIKIENLFPNSTTLQLHLCMTYDERSL